MRRGLPILILLLCPWVVYANPVVVMPQSFIAFGVVALFAMVVESGIETLAVIGSEVLIVPMFLHLVATNLVIFVFAFYPLLDSVAVWLLELGVVAVDTIVIMVLTSLPYLHGTGASCRRAVIASLLGNAASYFVGAIASAEPWFVHV